MGVVLLLAVAVACLIGPAWIGGEPVVSLESQLENDPAHWPWFQNAAEDCGGSPDCTDVAAAPIEIGE